MRFARMVAILVGLAAAAASAESTRRTAAEPPPLAVAGSLATLEIAPVLLAAHDFPGGASVRDGGIPSLFEAGSERALLATHAETQALRFSLAHPDLRILMTVTEGRYRIVARRSAGIARLADLRGKRIATLANTSAGYFLSRMLAHAGLAEGDVAAVRISPLGGIPDALARGEIDAAAIWEPHSAKAAQRLGSDALVFPGDAVYRERFNLNASAADLADPATRLRIVAFVRAVRAACERLAQGPGPALSLLAAAGGFEAADAALAWPQLDFVAALPTDLIDVLVAEEAWLAMAESRAPRSREALASLVDPSVLAEAATP